MSQQHSDTVDSNMRTTSGFIFPPGGVSTPTVGNNGSILGLPSLAMPIIPGAVANVPVPPQAQLPNDPQNQAGLGNLMAQWRNQFDFRQNELLHEYLERKLRLDAQQEQQRQQISYLVELWHRQQDFVEREQRKRRELETLRHKQASQHSANASPVVKECLQDFLKNKIQRRQTSPMMSSETQNINSQKKNSTSSATDTGDSPRISNERLVMSSASHSQQPNFQPHHTTSNWDNGSLKKYPSEPSLKAPSPLRQRLFSGRESPLHASNAAMTSGVSGGGVSKRRSTGTQGSSVVKRTASRSDSMPGYVLF